MPAPVVLPSSSINLPARKLKQAPAAYQPLARRLIEYGAGERAVAEGNGGYVRIRLGDYSCPIYQFDETMVATKADRQRTGWFWARNFPAGWSLNQGTAGNAAIAQKVPMSNALVAGSGNDQFVLVEDRPGGRVWCYWVFKQNEINILHPLNIARGGLDSSSPRLCNGGTDYHRPFSAGANGRGGRGMGLLRRALVTTAEEILEGTVRHAAALAITSTRWAAAKPGVEGQDWFPPATRAEWIAGQGGRTMKPSWLHRTVPEGLRIWNPRYAGSSTLINTWLGNHFDPGPQRDFWRIIFTQWCSYGLVVSETTNYGMGVDFDGMRGPARSIYEDFGFDYSQLGAHTQEDAGRSFLKDTIADWVVAAPAA